MADNTQLKDDLAYVRAVAERSRIKPVPAIYLLWAVINLCGFALVDFVRRPEGGLASTGSSLHRSDSCCPSGSVSERVAITGTTSRESGNSGRPSLAGVHGGRPGLDWHWSMQDT